MTCVRLYADKPYTIGDVLQKLYDPEHEAKIELDKDYELEVNDIGWLMVRARKVRRHRNGSIIEVQETEYTTRARLTLDWRRDESGKRWIGWLCIEPLPATECNCDCYCGE